MYLHLKERQYYEDNYDRLTVEGGRHDHERFKRFYSELLEKLPDQDPKHQGFIMMMNAAYVELAGIHLLNRYDSREQSIRDSMTKDQAKDVQITQAHLKVDPICQHCDQTGLRIIDKTLLHRGKDYHYDDPEEVLFTLRCPSCKKNSAYWEDGSSWERRHTYCPKCKAVMDEQTDRKDDIITTTYSCPDCNHSYKDELDLSPKEEVVDPDFEKDRAIYCLEDDKTRKELRDARTRFERMAEFGKELKEREENKHIYEAMAQIKKPKIAELSEILSPALDKAGYIEFTLDKPEIGKDVFVGFNCLDSKSDREDYESRKSLEKLITKTLDETNWRLMSDGVRYRLGYLSGRLRAYEREEDLKNLASKSRKLKQRRKSGSTRKSAHAIKGKDGEDIIL